MPKLTRLAVWMRSNDLAMHRLDAEVHRAERRVLAGGALAVAGAGHDDVVPAFVAAFAARAANSGSTVSKTNSEYFGMFERYFMRAPAGMMWSVVILSPTLIEHLAPNRLGERLVRAAGRRCSARGRSSTLSGSDTSAGEDDHAVVDAEALRHLDLRVLHAAGSRGSAMRPVRARRRGRLGAHEVDLGVLRAAAALEVAVRGAQRYRPSSSGHWLLPMQKPQAHSSIRAPAAIRSAEGAVRGDHLQHLARSRRDHEADVRVHATFPFRIRATVTRSR